MRDRLSLRGLDVVGALGARWPCPTPHVDLSSRWSTLLPTACDPAEIAVDRVASDAVDAVVAGPAWDLHDASDVWRFDIVYDCGAERTVDAAALYGSMLRALTAPTISMSHIDGGVEMVATIVCPIDNAVHNVRRVISTTQDTEIVRESIDDELRHVRCSCDDPDRVTTRQWGRDIYERFFVHADLLNASASLTAETISALSGSIRRQMSYPGIVFGRPSPELPHAGEWLDDPGILDRTLRTAYPATRPTLPEESTIFDSGTGATLEDLGIRRPVDRVDEAIRRIDEVLSEETE